ncbi:MAG: LiaF domain-containing protein [Acidobacteriota bacterium]
MYKNILIIFSSAMFLTGCVDEFSEIVGEVDPAHLSQEEALGNTEKLQVQITLGLGSLEVTRGKADSLYDLSIDYNGKNDEPEIDFSRSENSASLRVLLEGKHGSKWWNDENRIDISLSPEVDLDASFITGVGENIVDLTGMKVEKLEVKNGVGNTEIYMDEINEASCSSVNVTNGIGRLEMTGLGNYAFSDFSFNGGIGESSLDFSGKWESIGDISIKVGLGSLEVMLPDDVGVRVKSSKSFLSNLQMPGFNQVGNEYRSSNINEADKEIVIRLNTGIGDVRFNRQ